MITFACFSPHAPILLPEVGSAKNRSEVKKTISALETLGQEFKKAVSDEIIISSPHPDWGFEVPLYFLAKNFHGQITRYLTGSESPRFYFEKGTKFPISNSKVALVASGDVSHCLKPDGPYGFNEDGPKFDKALVAYLREKNIDEILKLDQRFPEAGECGLRSFCFLLGILETSGLPWQPEVLSYEGPFGVGYLVVNFKLD